ncbi:MAG: PH domain-containing protein [Roseiflexaceae bacterium]|nr:PH domain-containing protein [Roseiflexaceae bacterium]
MLEATLIVIPAVVLVLTVLSRLYESGEDLDLEPDEYIIRTAYRHWVIIFVQCFLFGAAALLFFATAFYRSIGGTLISGGVGETGMDIANILLLVVAVGLLVVRLWLGRQAREKKQRMPLWQRLLFLFILVTLGFLITFRYDGGRVFSIQTANAAGLDLLNALMISIGLVLVTIGIYTYFDLKDDSLVLTNFRVLRREVQEIPVLGQIIELVLRRKLVLREFLQQMVIEDVQQVNVKQDNYFEYYLYKFFQLLERFGVRGYKRYGTLVIQSLSFQNIIFPDAAAPADMQKAILDQVGEIKRRETPEALLQRTLEEQVWGGQRPAQRRFQRARVQQSAGLFSGLFPPNPEYIDDNKGTIIWRPAWLYILFRMLRAFGALAVALAAAVLVNSYLDIELWLLLAVIIPAVLGLLFWAWWIYDTYQHDLYILNSERLIDEDKAPFGPTNRREAELTSIQDVMFEESFVEGLLGFGQVTVRTGGGGNSEFTFAHVPNPREVQAQINAYVVEQRRAREEKTRQQTIQAITQYHLLQAKYDELLKPDMIDRLVGRTLESMSHSTKPDDAATIAVIEAARAEARGSAKSELRNLIRRLIRRQSRGRA